MDTATYGPKSVLTRDASGAPVVFNRIKRIHSHVGVGRYMDSLRIQIPGLVIPRVAAIPSPYAYSPVHQVYTDSLDRTVFIVETAHKQYDVFQVPATARLFVLLPDDSRQYAVEVQS